ncbi:MAG: ATP-grasp domain-containing protein, partial [Bacilli bacterium]|nr:ATP-grasp domain-containing protein [Bacilli bacterium]
MKIKVGVLFGGVSVEHEVSIISAVQAMQNMDKNKYEIVPIYMAKDRTWYTGKMLLEIDIYKDFEDLKRYATKVVLVNKEGRFCLQSTGLFKRIVEEIDIAFPIVHGAGVEDGTIQGYLATIGVPVVGSSVLGSALGQDKVIMKQIFESVGIPIVPYLWFFDDEYLNNAEEITKQVKKLGYPVIVKPASLGSSVGITVIKKEEDLEVGIMDAITYDSKIVVEKMVDNLVEVNCSVLGDYKFQQTSVLEEVMSTEEFLTYNDKYLSGTKGKKGSPSKGMASTDRIIPARLS